MEDEDADVGRIGELLLDPGVAPAADLPVVEVGLGRIDGDDRHPFLAQHRVALAEQILEVDVADVARVVVPRNDDERLALDLVENSRACWYSGLKPKDVRSPVHTTICGSRSLISSIARSSRAGMKYGPPQWTSEMCAIRKQSSCIEFAKCRASRSIC